MSGSRPLRRALLSVSDKRGLEDLAAILTSHGIEIISTGGTARVLRKAGYQLRDVADITDFPEMMHGRVKTLHPHIHGGILAQRDKAEHRAAMDAHAITAIDLVVVNLYPFMSVVMSGAERAEIIENIDIGGPAMLRSAAKNHADVTVIIDPNDYSSLGDILAAHKGATDIPYRKRMAAKAFAHSAGYDSMIAQWFAFTDQDEEFPQLLPITAQLTTRLRYGENPHQRAALYVGAGGDTLGIPQAEQLQGKTLSYNNINDADAALGLVSSFRDANPTCAIIKHANPCGVATAKTLVEAYRAAYECDSLSAFGGVVALNRPLDVATAQAITQIFTEVIIAPDVEPQARAIIAKKTKLRLLLTGALPDPQRAGLMVKNITGGWLVQSRDTGRIPDVAQRVVTQRAPTAREYADAFFAWAVVGHVASNAIVYAKDGATAGIGAGQMNRRDSAQIAAYKAKEAAQIFGWDSPRTQGAAVASDAFFPFADGLEAAISAGATCVIQPGGSVRDAEVIAAADTANIAMIFTDMRHFRH